MTTQTIVVLLGMHRSGTSAIARGLLEVGVDLGTNLILALPENPKGFWEDVEINSLNERLLEAIGRSWHSTAPIGPSAWQRREVIHLRLEALQLVRDRLHASRVWGFKDPRTAQLLPFWKSVLTQVTTDVRYVIVYRNPISVAKSLIKRNGFAPEKSYLLWLQHLVPAMRDTIGAPRVVVDYDNLVASPEREIRRIGSALGLRSLSVRDLEANEYVQAFVDAELRHSVFSSADLALDPQAARLVREANDLLQTLARDERDLSDPAVLEAVEQISDALENLGPFAAYLDRQECDLQNAEARLAERDSSVAAADAALAERDSSVAAAEAALAERDSSLKALTEEAAGLRLTIGQLQASVESYQSSACWRMTALLRALRRIVGGRP